MKEAVLHIPFILALVWVKVIGQSPPAVLGQSPPLIDPGIGTLVGNVGVIGILIWFLWYHTTHSSPRMADKIDQIGTKLDSVATKLDGTVDKIRTAFDKEQTETRAMLIEALRAMRTAVHDVRDTAQTALVRKREDEL